MAAALGDAALFLDESFGTTEERFAAAQVFLKESFNPNEEPSQEDRLALYSLYKQATVGDSDDADQPWMVQWEASLKWNAWTEHRGLTKDEAMRAYVAELGRQIEKYSPVAAS